MGCACSTPDATPPGAPAPGVRIHHIVQLRRFVRGWARRQRLAAQRKTGAARQPPRDEPAIEPENPQDDWSVL